MVLIDPTGLEYFFPLSCMVPEMPIIRDIPLGSDIITIVIQKVKPLLHIGLGIHTIISNT